MRNASKLVLIATAFSVLLPASMWAQTGPVVNNASFLEWDYTIAGTGVTAFNVYLSRTPGVVPDGTPDAVVNAPALAWPIVAATGQWYAVVTALAGTVESAPSNQVPFFVLASPENARIRVP